MLVYIQIDMRLCISDVFMSLVCQMALACGASETSEKTRPCILGACALRDVKFFWILQIFHNIAAGSNVSQKDVCVATACGASETPTKKHVPGIVEHVPYVLFFVAFCDSSSPLRIGSGCPAAMSGSSQPLHRIRFGWATAMEARRHCDP